MFLWTRRVTQYKTNRASARGIFFSVNILSRGISDHFHFNQVHTKLTLFVGWYAFFYVQLIKRKTLTFPFKEKRKSQFTQQDIFCILEHSFLLFLTSQVNTEMRLDICVFIQLDMRQSFLQLVEIEPVSSAPCPMNSMPIHRHIETVVCFV